MAREPLHIVRDTREQKRCGWMFDRDIFQPKPIVTIEALQTGDYSIFGHEDEVVVERKSLPDIVACLGVERERFAREIHRMRAYRSKCVIVEAPQSMLRGGEYRSQLLPGSAWQSILSFCANEGISFIWGEDAADAEKIAYDFLRHYANHFWKKARAIERKISTGAIRQ